MWIEQYDRNQPDPALDHSAFGIPGRTVDILDTASSASFMRTVIRFPDRLFPAAESIAGPEEEADRSHLSPCQASFMAGYSNPIAGTMFMPDHAFVTEEAGRPTLIAETFWHSLFCFNRYARNDISTNWKWKFDASWTASDAVEGLTFICYHRYSNQYFHWIMDCLPRVWLLRATHPRDAAQWFIGPLDKNFHLPSLALYGIAAEECISFEADRIVRFKNAVVSAFQFVEPLKTRRPGFLLGTWNIGWSPEFLDDLRDRARARYGSSLRDLKIYVSRSDALHRRIVNEAELLDVVREHGFTVIVPGQLSFAEQVEAFSRARVIVGAHGAGLTNLVWAAPGCAVLELAPLGLRDVGYRFSSQLCGHDFAVLSCKTFDHPSGVAFADIAVDLHAFRSALRNLP